MIDYGILLILTEFCGIHYLLSGGISFTVSVIYNYILSVKWVFDAGRQEDKKKEFLWFVTLSVIDWDSISFFSGSLQKSCMYFICLLKKNHRNGDRYGVQFCDKKNFSGKTPGMKEECYMTDHIGIL